jgi:fibronectin type 3 domain-containing protein
MKRIILILALALFAGMAHAQAVPAGFTKVTNVSTISYTDGACADQTTCYYLVTAVDASGHESPGASCSTTSLCFGGNQAVAIMPSSGTHTVLLAWTASATAGVTYNVYRAVGPLAASGLSATVQ